jgi:DNA-directed RNA polymerase subunit F
MDIPDWAFEEADKHFIPVQTEVTVAAVREVVAKAIMAATERERATIERLKGTLRYIHTQAKTRPSGDALTLSVIERNAHAALDDGFQNRIASIKKQANDDFRSIPHGGTVS